MRKLRVVQAVLLRACAGMAAAGPAVYPTPSAPPGASTKDLPQYRCRLTLPDDSWQWQEPPVPGAAASAISRDGLSLALLVIRPKRPTPGLVDAVIRGFEQGFLESSQARKVGGRKLEFRGVPCYELTARVEAQGVDCIVRLFLANDLSYQVMVLGPAGVVRAVPDMEKLFGAFQFS